MLCAEPKEHKRFRPGTRPGGIGFPAGRIGDRGDREIVYAPNVYVPFPAPSMLDERQIIHLICARLKYDLYDFFRGVLGPLYKKKNRKQAQKHPYKSQKDHFLAGHRLDE